MAGRRVSRRSGRHGGRYPADHIRGDGECRCRGCLRLATLREQEERRREAELRAEWGRLRKQDSEQDSKPAPGREDLDYGVF